MASCKMIQLLVNMDFGELPFGHGTKWPPKLVDKFKFYGWKKASSCKYFYTPDNLKCGSTLWLKFCALKKRSETVFDDERWIINDTKRSQI